MLLLVQCRELPRRCWIYRVIRTVFQKPSSARRSMRRGLRVPPSLTEAGEHTDPFTLQYVAGHDSIETTMRYVHPREAAVHKLFARLGDLQRPEEGLACQKSVQNPVQLEMPPEDVIANLLITGNLRSAEVVELADTPS
jgi:hypothetical protein